MLALQVFSMTAVNFLPCLPFLLLESRRTSGVAGCQDGGVGCCVRPGGGDGWCILGGGGVVVLIFTMMGVVMGVVIVRALMDSGSSMEIGC